MLLLFHAQSLPVGEELGLSFRNVCVDVTDKRILWSVSGEAKPGKILALMGPSGTSLTLVLHMDAITMSTSFVLHPLYISLPTHL